MIPLAKELPDLRERLLSFCEGPYAAPLMGVQVSDRPPVGAPVTDTPDVSFGQAASARDAVALREAELFQIQPHMVDLLGQARHGLDGAGFMDYDLPGHTGLAHFAVELERHSPGADLPAQVERHNALAVAAGTPEDVVTLDDATRRMAEYSYVEHLLCVWRARPPSAEYEHGAVELSWWFERDAWMQRNLRLNEAIGDGHALAVSERSYRVLPTFVPDGRDMISFAPDGVTTTTERAEFDADAYFRSTRPDMFRALCFLIRQRVAETSTVMPDRAARRRMAREGKEPPPVRVISLRGGSAHGGGDGSREYVHRWMVRGHWRRQWYPSIQQHRPIWVSPHVKGPEDAPLLGGEKVYTVRA